MKTVRTFDGSMAPKDKCRKIINQYYEENKQCFYMPDGKWHRINNGKIFFDHELSEYTFSRQNLTKGVVGFENDGTLKLGYFTRKVEKNIKYYDGGEVLYCISREIVEKLDVDECIGDSIFYTSGSFGRGHDFNKKTITNPEYSRRLDYRCGYRLDEITKSFNQYFKGSEFKHSFHQHLPDVTYGIEYETTDGRIPEDLMMQNGLIPVKDGSLRRANNYLPFEYATIIMQGKTGLQAIKKQCELLEKYCEKGMSGSLHVHIGNIPRTKEYTSAIYQLSVQLQDEIYDMFPKFYRNTSKFKASGADYCNPLRKIAFKAGDVEYNFKKVFNEVAGNEDCSFKEFGSEHPSDPEGNSKWSIKSRYKLINIIPLIFGKSGTVEFRIHGSTFNHDKITNWLYIIAAITKFADKYKNEINSNPKLINDITIDRILNDIYGSSSHVLSSYLTQYVDYRKSTMIEYSKQGDDSGKLDLKNDHLDNFKSQINSLVL